VEGAEQLLARGVDEYDVAEIDLDRSGFAMLGLPQPALAELIHPESGEPTREGDPGPRAFGRGRDSQHVTA
jgi:hypothetical protein